MTGSRAAHRIAAIAAVAIALTLVGCGRKGPLDPPPTSSQLQPGTAPAPGGAPPAQDARQGFDQYGRPVAPTSTKTSRFLDWLLD